MLLRSFEYFVTNASDQIALLLIVCDDNANFYTVDHSKFPICSTVDGEFWMTNPVDLRIKVDTYLLTTNQKLL